jgi:hypothetical protein
VIGASEGVEFVGVPQTADLEVPGQVLGTDPVGAFEESCEGRRRVARFGPVGGRVNEIECRESP